MASFAVQLSMHVHMRPVVRSDFAATACMDPKGHPKVVGIAVESQLPVLVTFTAWASSSACCFGMWGHEVYVHCICVVMLTMCHCLSLLRSYGILVSPPHAFKPLQ
jgi:hypothetical protein